MHELSIAISMIEVAEEEAANHGDRAATAVYVRVGALSGVAPSALAAAYDLAREDTSLAACRLIIEETPGPDLLVTALEFEI